MLQLVALGDSETTGNGDPTAGGGWVQYYARLLEAKLGSKVDVKNLAQDGLSSDQLLASLRTEPTSTAVKDAEIVVLGIGGADLNEGDDNLQAGACRAEACYTPVLKAFAKNFEAVATSIGDCGVGRRRTYGQSRNPTRSRAPRM
jgi:lysophospholipase L1-like esterase